MQILIHIYSGLSCLMFKNYFYKKDTVAKLKIYYSVFINKLSLESSGRINIGGTLASMFGI